MNFPDARTLVLLVGLLYLILPAFTWMVLKPYPYHAAQVSLWCGGGFLIGCGAIVAAASSDVTSPAWTSLVTLLFTASYCLRIQALRLDLGIAWRTRALLWLGSALFLMVVGISYGLGLAVLGTEVNNLIEMALFLHIGWMARRIAVAEKSKSAQWIAAVYALLGIAFLYRATAFSGASAEPTVVTSHLETVLVAFFGMLSASIGHFGYIGLQLERARRRTVQSRELEMRHGVARRLNARIAHQERQHILDEMSASLAREITGPLNAISREVQAARQGLEAACMDRAGLVMRMQDVVGHTGQAVEMIQRIRTFIRPSPGEAVQVDLGAMAQDAIKLVANEARSRGVQIALHRGVTPVLTHGDSSELTQIILSLLRNAMDVVQHAEAQFITVSTALQEARAVLQVHYGDPGVEPPMVSGSGHAIPLAKTRRMTTSLVIARTIAAQYGGTLNIGPARQADGLVSVAEVSFPGISTATT